MNCINDGRWMKPNDRSGWTILKYSFTSRRTYGNAGSLCEKSLDVEHVRLIRSYR